jgi:hypothetical protein
MANNLEAASSTGGTALFSLSPSLFLPRIVINVALLDNHRANTRLVDPIFYYKPALRAFRSKTDGRCFVCLAADHRAASCRDPIRCFKCRRSGHRERDCREFDAARRARAAAQALRWADPSRSS